MALESKNPVVRMSVIDLLVQHGSAGVKDITDIIELPDSDDIVKQHGLSAIRWFRAVNKHIHD